MASHDDTAPDRRRDTARRIADQLADAGVRMVASLPDNWISELIREIDADRRFRHVPVNREESAIGLCSGAYMGGMGSAALMGASGFMTVIYAITKINYTYEIPLFLLLPVLLGVFWGAPLIAREVEQGTHRLAWTQSVTRRRWTVTKLVIVGSVAVLLSSAFSAVLWWWADPLVGVPSVQRFTYGIFDLLGVVPVAYTLFAVALGVAAGVVLQRTTFAMAATLCGFAVARLAAELGLRPNYQSAVVATYPFNFTSDAGPPGGSWVLAENTVTASGFAVSGDSNGISLNYVPMQHICPYLTPDTAPGSAAMQQCIIQNGIHVVATFQPYDRYWLFQGIESALFIVLAISLALFSVWWVRRRVR